MRSGSGLALVFGGLFGTESGAGMGLLIALCGLLAALVAVGGYFVPAIREAEDRLPDYDQRPAEQPSPA